MAHFGMIFEPMLFHIQLFVMFWLHKQAENSNACFAFRLDGVSIFWLRLVHGNEGVSDRDNFFLFRNIPPVSASVAKATKCFSVGQTIRMGPFSFGLGVSVGGG